jgi:hypothetical protein
MEDSQNNSRNIHRYTVAEAAEALKVSQAAIRSRIHRETLDTERVEGTVYVLLSDEQIAHQSSEKSLDVIELLREQSADLREQLTVLREELVAEREASAELRRIIAGLVQRVPELEAASEPRESAITVSKDEGKVPTEAEHRSWWQRMFGG